MKSLFPNDPVSQFTTFAPKLTNNREFRDLDNSR